MKSTELKKQWQSDMNGSTPTPTTRVDVPVSSVASPELLDNVQRLLDLTPADDYSVWFENACALKRLGIPYEFFRRWSAKSEKFDENECAQKWEELPDELRAGWPTLVKNAASSSFIPVPEEMLPVPQTKDECARQAAHYLATTFKPHELFEICEFEQKPNAKKPVPKRDMNLSALSDEDTEDALCNDETLLSWIHGEPFGGAVVSINPLKIPDDFTGYAPTDECVSDHRLVLVEGDVIPIKDQWAKLKLMHLPIKSIVNSAGKSLHVRCFIDAGKDSALYKARVNKLYEYVRRFGFIPDENCKNASRPTRLPGPMRDGNRQYLVCGPCGYPDWEMFELCELHHGTATAAPASLSTEAISPHAQHDRLLHQTVTASMHNDSSCPEGEKAILDDLKKKYGPPFTLTAKGMVAQVSEVFFAGYVMELYGLIKSDNVLWKYEEETGVWSMLDSAELNDIIVQTAHHYGEMTEHDELVSKMTEPVCNHIRRFMRNSKVDPFKTRPKNVVHAANGMVEISKDGTCTLKPFDRKYYSQWRCDIAYNPNAQCPRFINDLLKPQMEYEDDLNILLLYGAQCILPDNAIQKFLVITGTPGGGKDTSVNILRAIVGDKYCAELRKGYLADKFEAAGYIGHSLLLGSDVDPDFLLGKDAGTVKKLCGGNLVDAEIKGVTKKFPLEGRFKIIITSNDRLKVRVENDMGAWGRRRLDVPFVGLPPENPIDDFDKVLLEEEGEGILNLLIQKAAELIQHGFPKESHAHTRAMRILYESESPLGFLTTCVEKDDSSPGITKDELVERYIDWCCLNNWTPLVGNEARKRLWLGMESIFHITESHDVNGLRGYHGVAFKADTPTA